MFINQNCTFMDRGGITIDDNALIAPRVNLITINHCIEPSRRRDVYSKPIHICKNVWIYPRVASEANAAFAVNADIAIMKVIILFIFITAFTAPELYQL